MARSMIELGKVNNGNEHGHYCYHSKEHITCRLPVSKAKTFYEKLIFKISHRKNFPLYFEHIAGKSSAFEKQHFPCEFRANLFVF